jgi:hypothetical protein
MGRTGWKFLVWFLTSGVFLLLLILELSFRAPWFWIGLTFFVLLVVGFWIASFGPGETLDEIVDDIADDNVDSDPVHASELVAEMEEEDHSVVASRAQVESGETVPGN